MKSTIVKRSIVLAGHKTSVSLEDAFWEGLKEIAKTRRKTLSGWLAASIPSASKATSHRPCGCLSLVITASGLVIDNIARAAEYTNVIIFLQFKI